MNIDSDDVVEPSLIPFRHFIASALVAVSTLSFSSLLLAQVEVVEAEPVVITDSRYPKSTQAQASAASANTTVDAISYDAPPAIASDSDTSTAGLFVQLQDLQAEVRELRGLLEQQNYIIEQLSQKRMDDYLDLDRRIGELTVSLASASRPVQAGIQQAADKQPVTSNDSATKTYSTASVSSENANKPVAVPSSPPVASKADVAKKAYRAAYQKVKDRQFDQARVSLAAFISAHPQSHYVPNAYFWLGELYYLESDLPRSKQSFDALIKQYPTHRKVADAKFKLGKVYHQLGDNAAAREMLESVLNDHSGSTAANPAREYLNNSLR